MLETALIAVLVCATMSFVVLRFGRLRLYRGLEERSHALASPAQHWQPFARPATLPSFASNIARLDVALPESEFAKIRDEIASIVSIERSYLPSHKKGGTVAYETLIKRAPETVRLYQSAAFQAVLSDIVGERLHPTPIHDQSSCSVLFYDRPGDHIGWHYDHNFYRGRHVTVLLPIINHGHASGDLSSANLQTQTGTHVETIPTPPNSLIIFEGQKVLHRVTPIAHGERRIILSMTYCTDPRNTWFQGAKRRIKDTAFFGVRALWT